ncbi:MAG: ketose-bisphosphate aldolase, partial [Gammaproteobacteria bacterium]
MAMVDMKDLMYHAYKNRYAVGAFGIVNLDFLQAVIDAAERTRSPVILNVVETHFSLYDPEILMAAIIRAAKRATIPVAVHMDHCSSIERVQAAIRLGCNSVMFDAATKSFPENVEKSRNVATMAHACGVPVEGEIGYVTEYADENGESQPDSPIYTHVEEARAYIDKTDVDFLAVSIGTVHGRVKTKHRLDFSRLARIQEKVNIPCVIHGGTGLSDQQFRKLIDHGVTRINFYTALAEAGNRQIAANLKQKASSHEQVFAGVREKISEEVERCMRVLSSAGRAAEVIMQCQPWRNIEHVIFCKPSTWDEAAIHEMLHQGQQDLQKIPGVLDVRIGRSVDATSSHNYCWILRFANENVLESYQTHPVYEAYSEKYIKP